MSLPHCVLRLAALGATLAAASTARAAPFDEATGTVSLAGSSFAWSLDSLDGLPSGVTVRAKDAAGATLAPAAVGAVFSQESVGGIEGKAGLWLGKVVERLDFGFEGATALGHRRVEVTLWQRPVGVEAAATLTWSVGTNPSRRVGMLKLQPTGRRTDDGWFELGSGPVDFALGGALLPTLAVRVERVGGAHGGSVGTDPNGLVLIDALELADLGPAAVPPVRCQLASEPSACGEHGVCQFGRCVDGAAIVGRRPAPGLREEYLDRRVFEVSHFFGNRVIDQTYGDFMDEMQKARAATSAAGYWRSIFTAYDRLGDAHGGPPVPGSIDKPGAGACVHLGVADRLPGREPLEAPLVFYADPESPAASRLLPGDVLETVDDLPVDLWRLLAGTRLSFYGTPLARKVVTTPRILDAAAAVGARVGFRRCPAAIGATRACLPAETIKLEVDYYGLYGEPLWRGEVSGWRTDPFGCDYRFKRVGGTVPQSGYNYAASGDDGGIRTLEFNGLPQPLGTSPWTQTVNAALQPGPSSFLVDERLGYGGYIYTLDSLVGPFMDPDAPVVSELFPKLEAPLDAATRDSFLACGSGWSGCGEFLRWENSRGRNVGTLKDAKVAVLITRDVSGNDWVTRLHKARPGKSRIFGPCPTHGGFGHIFDLAAHLGEMSGGSCQITDAVIYQGEAPASLAFESGHGVEPDEVVYQTQSDLLQDRDTLVERAKAWLRQ